MEVDKNREFMFFCERLLGKVIFINGKKVSKSEAFWGGLSSTDILEGRYKNVNFCSR